jgi:hypothetical protein
MRGESTISLGAGRDVAILEARVRDMRRLMALLPAEGEPMDLAALARERLPDILALLDECLRLPDGETLDDLTLSECETVLAAWWEMHRGFFERALAAAGLELVEQTPDDATSTAPVSH